MIVKITESNKKSITKDTKDITCNCKHKTDGRKCNSN